MLPREHYLKQPFNCLRQLPATHTLNPAQVRLLKKHGTLITALLDDEVIDPTIDDLRLLKTIRQQSAPTSPIEQAWLKYQYQLPTSGPLQKSA
ncbi:MAG TPA: DUF413 domain-containing protein [Cellvibrionaceae bacterium]